MRGRRAVCACVYVVGRFHARVRSSPGRARRACQRLRQCHICRAVFGALYEAVRTKQRLRTRFMARIRLSATSRARRVSVARLFSRPTAVLFDYGRIVRENVVPQRGGEPRRRGTRSASALSESHTNGSSNEQARSRSVTVCAALAFCFISYSEYSIWARRQCESCDIF